MNNPKQSKQAKRNARIARVRATVIGTALRPRLAVFRSLKHISVQLIDDASGKTLVSASDLELTAKAKSKKSEKSELVGKLLAEKAVKKGITAVVFDRRSYKYHGRVKSVATGARAAGLKF